MNSNCVIFRGSVRRKSGKAILFRVQRDHLKLGVLDNQMPQPVPLLLTSNKRGDVEKVD